MTFCRIYARVQRDRCLVRKCSGPVGAAGTGTKAFALSKEADPSAGPLCGIDPHHRAPISRPPGEPGDRPAHVSLWSCEDTPHATRTTRLQVRRETPALRLVHPDRRNRQRSLTKPHTPTQSDSPISRLART